MFRLKEMKVFRGPFFFSVLCCSFILSGLILFFSEFVFAQCVGGAGANIICNNDGNIMGSSQLGFDPRLQLIPAVLNADPLLGPCFTCGDASIEATAGSLTDSFAGILRLPGAANQGDLGRGPAEQGMTLPTAPGGNASGGLFSIPLPPFGSFVFSDPEIASDSPTTP